MTASNVLIVSAVFVDLTRLVWVIEFVSVHSRGISRASLVFCDLVTQHLVPELRDEFVEVWENFCWQWVEF